VSVWGANGNGTPANANGWTNGSNALVWACSKNRSGPVEPTVTKTVSTDGANQSATGTCEDQAGNSASDTQTGIDVDTTRPTVVLRVDAARYTVDQTVRVTCHASDALSGVAATTLTGVPSAMTCQGATVAAYQFALGASELRATAADNAGNMSSASAAVVVDVIGDAPGGGDDLLRSQPVRRTGGLP